MYMAGTGAWSRCWWLKNESHGITMAFDANARHSYFMKNPG